MARKEAATRFPEDYAVQLGRLDEKVSNIKDAVDAQAADIKEINHAIQSFTFVKESDYVRDQKQKAKQIADLQADVETLKSNTSPLVQFKNAVGERLTQVLVLVFFALVIYGVYIILKHTAAANVVTGGTER